MQTQGLHTAAIKKRNSATTIQMSREDDLRREYSRSLRNHRQITAASRLVRAIKSRYNLRYRNQHYYLRAAPMSRDSHADTRGGYEPHQGAIPAFSRPEVRVSTRYVERMMGGRKYGVKEDFAKLVRTIQHEWQHTSQRHDPSKMQYTSEQERKAKKAMREFQAYSSEILDFPDLPKLSGQHLIDTIEKAKDMYNDLQRYNPQLATQMRTRYDQLRLVETGQMDSAGQTI